MEAHAMADWQHASAEDIDRAVNGSISAGKLVKTKVAKTFLDRLLYALDCSCHINEASSHIKLLIYNIHREINGQAPLESLDGLNIQIFNVFVPRGGAGCSANELYIVEDGKIVRLAELNIENDLLSNRLKEYYLELSQEPNES